jgi:hypothetical protein
MADRRRRLRLTEVALTTPSQGEPAALPTLAAAEREFMLGAGRRSWPAVQRRLGERAWPLAVELARAGILAVRCAVTEDMRLGSPNGWQLLDRGAQLALEHGSVAAARLAQVEQRRADLIARLAGARTADDPVLGISAVAVESLLHALRHETGPVRRLVLCAAAADLLDGVTHDGPGRSPSPTSPTARSAMTPSRCSPTRE